MTIMLKVVRVAKGLKQKDIGALVGLDQGNYSRVENGLRNATSRQADALSAALGVPSSVLFGSVQGCGLSQKVNIS